MIAVLIGAALAGAPAAAITPPRLKPPAPKPAFADQSDLVRLKAVVEAAGRRDYASVRSAAAGMRDATAKSLARWYYFDLEDPQVSIADADAFLDSHPDWPSIAKIQTHVEKRILWTTDPSTILALFESRDPLTGEGKIQLARAQLSIGRNDAAELHVKDAWINNNFTLADEQRLLASYGSKLTPDDHQRRVDRLLWSREVSTARRTFPRLAPDARRRAEARAALLLGGADGPRLYDNLSAEDRADPGVMLAAVRYYRRMEEEPRAIAIARGAPTDAAALRNPVRWWDEQNLLLRWALQNRQYADAYAMASHHGLDPGLTQFAEAEFDAGWIALRFLNDPARAERHFGALTANVSAPISLSRGWYWLARAAETKGEQGIALSRYAKASEQIYTFYGQLAAEKTGGPALLRAFEETPPATAEEKARFLTRPAASALRMLTDVKDDRAFLIFAYHVDDHLQSRGEFRELANLALKMNAPHVAVRAGKVAVRAGAFAPDIAYPEISIPGAATRYAPAEVILGLSRQESEFNPRAYSRAGARGVMQLIPSTAQITAKKAGLPYRRSGLLDDPHYNMTLGSAHLSHLLQRFSGSYVMTFAAYNAGPHRVDQWVAAYGDPRAANIDPIDWIEQIPFEETRNYVQRVLENSQIYRSRLGGGAIAGTLSRDIERGGPQARIAAIAPISSPGAIPEVQPRIVQFAEPILAPLAAPAALQHVRVKPSPVTATEVESAPAVKTPTRGSRRPSFRQRRTSAPTAGPHEESATAPAPIAAEEAPTEPAAPPLVMDPVDSASQAAIESEPAYAEEALAPDPADPFEPVRADATDNRCINFIAETTMEEASADDLNASALAELKGVEGGCDGVD